MSSKAYIDQKMLFLDRRTPQSHQNPKNFQFRQKQPKFPNDCATSHPNRPTELRDIIENRTFFFIYKKKGCERDTEYPFKGGFPVCITSCHIFLKKIDTLYMDVNFLFFNIFV